MWRHEYIQDSTLSPETLWPVLANVAGWPDIDQNIASLELLDPPARGARFVLRPRGGPRLRFTIGAFEAPNHYADICQLAGATMTTVHRLTPLGTGTRIAITIEVRGWLSWFWAFAAGRRHASGLPDQTQRFIAAAMAQASATGA
jgi:hypothetical protein